MARAEHGRNERKGVVSYQYRRAPWRARPWAKIITEGNRRREVMKKREERSGRTMCPWSVQNVPVERANCQIAR